MTVLVLSMQRVCMLFTYLDQLCPTSEPLPPSHTCIRVGSPLLRLPRRRGRAFAS